MAVVYAVYPGIAPLASGRADDESRDDVPLQAQGIRVVPVPVVLGYTRLYLELDGPASARQLVSEDIPVLASCAS